MSSLTWSAETWELLPPGSLPQEESQDFVGYDSQSHPEKSSSRQDSHGHTLRRCFWGFLGVILLLKIFCLAQQGDTIFFKDAKKSYDKVISFLDDHTSVFPHTSSHEPIPAVCYSHNAQGRRVPLQSAISSDCSGIEMTVYPSANELLVGPHPDTLSSDLDLNSLYLSPLLRTLLENNTPAERSRAGVEDGQWNGIFMDDPTRSLVLLIRLRMDSERSWSLLTPQLEALREAQFLTYYNGSTIVPGPVTIVASGDAPFHRVLEGTTQQDIFYDIPLAEYLSSSTQSWDQDFGFSTQNSYFTSADFHDSIGEVSNKGFTKRQISRVRNHVRLVHEQGLKLRYWDSMGWPREHRDLVWHTLLSEGVDSITIHR